MADADRHDIPRSDPSRSDPNQGDKGRGVWNNVHQTPIRVDERGRRRRDNGDVDPFPAVKDDPTKELVARVAALEKVVADYVAKNDARTITGGGNSFSGTLGSGIKFTYPSTMGGGGIPATDLLSVKFCDGTTADLLAQNVVPGP